MIDIKIDRLYTTTRVQFFIEAYFNLSYIRYDGAALNSYGILYYSCHRTIISIEEFKKQNKNHEFIMDLI